MDEFKNTKMTEKDNQKEQAFRTFMEKMDAAEKAVLEHGHYSEEEVEEALAEI